MRRTVRGIAVLATTIVLAACGGGGTATAPGATTGPVGTTGVAAPCAESTAATVVAATVAGNTWSPVSAAVGDVITWTNNDAVPHAVALDDGSCAMAGNIPGGGTRSLAFTVAGSFPFHCSVHPSMKGTITIS
jgi:plastocyanin